MSLPNDPIALAQSGVKQLIDSPTNKKSSYSVEPEQVGVEEDELTLKLDDEELLSLKNRTEIRYASYYGSIKARQLINLSYYLGNSAAKGFDGVAVGGQVIDSNIMWEACETLIAAALAQNPEPVVYANNDEPSNEIATDVKTLLVYHTTELMFRDKMKLMFRNWMVDLLGVGKTFWNHEIKDIDFKIFDVKDFVFDPKGYVDVYGDFCGMLGQRITLTASELIDLFPSHKEYILDKVDNKKGTKVTYTEWWNDDYTFSTFFEKVLDKSKNPNFNYGKGAKNHFAIPKKPYTFFSVYSFGQQPHDVTNVIEQNIPNQNRITRRTVQIDYNTSRSNKSTVFSKQFFNDEEAKQASQAMAKGHDLLVPGDIDKAIRNFPVSPLPSSMFEALENDKNDLRSIGSVNGLTAQGPQNEPKTARGMILDQQYDNTRIGGTIGEKLAMFAQNAFNQFVQFYYVYYDDAHYGAILGKLKGVEYSEISQSVLAPVHLSVTVAANSLRPKDDVSKANQAMSMWEAGVLDPKTLLKILDFSDPDETAESVVLWLLDKNTYLQLNFPDLAQKIAMVQQQSQGQQIQGGGQSPQAQQPIQSQAPTSVSSELANASLSQVPLPR